MSFRVKEERERAGITQEELSKRSGVSRAIISGLENGSIETTTTKTLIKISDALGKKVSDIFLQ